MILVTGDSNMEHHIDYKQKYKGLKKKLKFLVYEQECFLEELRKAQRRLLKVSRDRSFLLDRLLQHEKVEESSGDSDATASSDSDADGHKGDGSSAKRKRGSGALDPSSVFGGLGFSAYAQGPQKKKSKTASKKKKTAAKSNSESAVDPMSREELERHLDSKQPIFGIEKAPALLPMEIFSNDNSNPDSDTLNDFKDGDEDSDLVIDTQ